MGSSCSSRQSGKDSASVKSEDSQDEQTEQEPTAQNQSGKMIAVAEKEKAKDKTALKLIESDFSSGGDEGAGAGTPVSSSMSACAANGSTKGKPPEKGETKASEELPDLSLLKEETNFLLTGNVLEERELKKGNKICVVVLGRLDDTGERTREMMSTLSKEIAQQMDEKGIEVVILNPHQSVPLLTAPYSPSTLLSQYLAEQSNFSSILVFLLCGTNAELHELPTSLSEADFSQVTASVAENEKELLQKWFIHDAYNSSLRKIKQPQKVFEGLLSNNAREFDLAYGSWSSEYRRIMDAFSGGGSEDQSKLRLKTTIERDLQWIQKMGGDISLKVILIRKDAKRTPTEDKLDQFLENLGTDEAVCETARQIFEEKRTGFDILRPKILADERSEDWWKEITSVMRSTVRECIEASSTSPQDKKVNPLEDGIKAKLLEEISFHRYFTLQNHLRKPHGLDEYLNQIQKYLKSSVRKAMLIFGTHGSGKTSLVSLATGQCPKWSPGVCVMTRYIGLTNNCTTLEGLLYYLVEHTIVTHGQPSSYVCTDMSLSLQNLWQKATSNRRIIVFIDGVDQVISGWSNLLDLVTELPEHVKIILTTQDISLRDDFSKRVQNADCLLKIENPNSENCKSLLKDFMLNNEQNLSDSVWEKAQKKYHLPVAPLSLLILSQLFFLGTTNDDNFGSTLEDRIKFFLNKLKNLYHEVFIQNVLGCLALTRGGLLECEILSIVKSTYSSGSYNAVLEWLCLQKILTPLLRVRKENGLIVVAFSSTFVRETVAKCLLETEDKVNKCHEIFKKHVIKHEEKKILDISLSEDQKGSLSLMRALHEGLLIMEKKREEGKAFFNISWLFKIIETSGPFKILEEIDLALQKNSQNQELSILREVIQLSSASLVYDSSQFFSQIYGRLKWRLCMEENCTRLSALLSSASESPLPCLLPISSCLTVVRQDKSILKDEKKTTYIDSIFRIPCNPHHVIAISTNRSQVTVWNIFTMEVVRTLSGINQPRNLKMIDDFKCLLLCGRELRIYNLNEGTFLMKLREVMNQKSPFFGLHDSDHVVALSRSRMYVNMMNLTEGNCVTTFKVGEDRFLNSLLVSENGKICVCGDDSQKPSALLVWDLQLRKLMYDLRIPHHEFATRLAAITTEGHYVCCVCKEVDEPAPNFIVVYDLQSGTLFKRWKPEVNTISIAISTLGTCVIVGLEDSSIMAFDLITGNRRWTVFGHTYPPDTFRLDHKGLVLLSYDSQRKDHSLRVWEVPTGKSLATLTPDQKISTCEITCDGKAVVLALEGLDAIFTFLLLHKEDPMKVTEKSVPYGDDQCKGKVVDFSRA